MFFNLYVLRKALESENQNLVLCFQYAISVRITSATFLGSLYSYTL